MSDIKAHHFLQAHGILAPEEEIEFYDPNLAYDSPLFLDPFLLKKSPVKRERELFERLSDFFLYVYHQAQYVQLRQKSRFELEQMVTFHEPQEVYLGYSANGNKGKGPGKMFAQRLISYYLNESASKFVDRAGAFPNGLYNPYDIEVFTDRVGPDNISDLTIQLIKDYLIEFTREQCEKYGIPIRKELPISNEGYDYIKNEWKGDAYIDLPEDPRDPGSPVILIPKRLLRATDDILGSPQSRVVKVLRQDPELAIKFKRLLAMRVEDISMKAVRQVLASSEKAHLDFYKNTEEERSQPYDFNKDRQQISADKRYEEAFKNIQLPVQKIEDCQQVIDLTLYAVNCYKEEFDNGDAWREAWRMLPKRSENPMPVPEPALGRKFRGIANGIFNLFDDITFDAEVGINGRGFVDFRVIYKDCRIAIELKLLDNAATVKKDPIPAYLRGVTKQLPLYIKSGHCKYGIYMTGQHYTEERPDWTKTNHDSRRQQVIDVIDQVEEELKQNVAGFKNLYYVNIDMSPKESASKL